MNQVEDVELVDPGRDDQQRALGDGRRRRLVLQQLDEIVLVDDLARRHRDVLADLERLVVGHLDREPALAALDVVEEVLQSFDEILALGLEGGAHDLGIGQREVRGRHRVDELLRVKLDLVLGLFVEAVGGIGRVLDVARGEQIALLDEVEGRVLRPLAVLEAPVRRRGLDHGPGGALVEAPEAAHRVAPELHVVLPERRLHLPQFLRVLDEVRRHLRKGVGDVERVGVFGRVGGLALQVLGHHLARALGQLRHLLRRYGGFGGLLLIGHLRFLYNAPSPTAARRPDEAQACFSRLGKCI
jgi:hypothetical protein